MPNDFTLVGALPKHLYCYVDRAFIRKDGTGFEPAVWFGLVSFPGRAWGLNVLLECGAVYRNLPPHTIAFVKEPPADEWDIRMAQKWDCYGYRFTVIAYPYLDGLRIQAAYSDPELGVIHCDGDYLFTVAPIGDGFSAEPGQAKEFTFCKLDNGRLTIQPTNHVLVQERSFTTDSGWPTDLIRQTEIYSCEE